MAQLPHRTEILMPTDALRIRREGTRVLLIKDGRTVANMPYQAALEVGRALLAQGRQAETCDHVEQLIADQALLYRVGCPFGITVNPWVQGEAMKTAHTDRDLRRYLPGGVRSQEAVGTPALIQLPFISIRKEARLEPRSADAVAEKEITSGGTDRVAAHERPGA